jgi:prefoldin subunit 5
MSYNNYSTDTLVEFLQHRVEAMDKRIKQLEGELAACEAREIDLINNK